MGTTGTEATAATWITLAVIGLFVWGGFTVALVTAVRKESVKAPPGPGATEAPGPD